MSTSNTSGNQTFLQWQTWPYLFVTWFSSQFTHGEDVLDWAKIQVVEVRHAEVTAKSTTSGWTDLSRNNAQLQDALASLCRDEALTVIRKSPSGQGRTLGGDSARKIGLPTQTQIFDCSDEF